MTKSFNEKLVELLKTDPRFVDGDGDLIRAAVIDRAWNINHDLVKLLLGKPDIKKTFFDEIEGHWVFNTNAFIEYVSDKNFLADSYTRFRNKIGLNIDGKFLRERGEVSLVWPYKDCVLEGGQTKEEEKRKEIFFNETLAQDEIDRLFDPKVLTNWKRYTVDGERKVTKIKRDENGMIRENLIIKGNNLLALHTLKRQFRGKVKLIYIDPPYNTGNDSFGYNDNFNHSSWLTFMKNRLEAARELLRDDGVIFVQCDDNEQAYLKVLMDEVFGRENFVNNISIKMSESSGVKMSHVTKKLPKIKENILLFRQSLHSLLAPIRIKKSSSGDDKLKKYLKYYSKIIVNMEEDIENWIIQPLKKYMNKNSFATDERSIKEFKINNADKIVYRTNNKSFEKLKIKGKKITRVTSAQGLEYIWWEGKQMLFLNDYMDEYLCDLWTDVSTINLNKEGGVDLKNGKKPEKLIYRIIDMSTQQGDLVLDYHLGTGTTCAVAHKMERQYIGIEQLDYGESDSTVRLQNVIGKRTEGTLIEELEGYDQSGISKSVNWQGGDDFIYCELMKYNEAYMDKIQSAKASKQLVALWKDIAENSFLNWYANSEMPKQAVADFIETGKTENGLDKQKKLLAGLLNKNQLYVNLSEIDDRDFKVKKEDKKLNREFYGDL